MEPLRFTDVDHPRPPPSGMDVSMHLEYFALITYAVPPELVGPLLPLRFAADTVQIEGREMALLSVVPFNAVDFTSAVYPCPRFRFGQTNYRVYVIDRDSEERVVWFIGTVLDSWTLFVPRRVWRLPWYPGKVRYQRKEVDRGRSWYSLATASEWGGAEAQFEADPEPLSRALPGFPDVETGLVLLSHPMAGYYHRLDGVLGGYRVWHRPLEMRAGRLMSARFELLDRLGLVPFEKQGAPHSVLVQDLNAFTIYLPPKVLR